MQLDQSEQQCSKLKAGELRTQVKVGASDQSDLIRYRLHGVA